MATHDPIPPRRADQRSAALDAANTLPRSRRRLLPLFLVLALLAAPLIWLARRESPGDVAERARADSVALPVGDGSTGAATVAGTSGFTTPQAGATTTSAAGTVTGATGTSIAADSSARADSLRRAQGAAGTAPATGDTTRRAPR